MVEKENMDPIMSLRKRIQVTRGARAKMYERRLQPQFTQRRRAWENHRNCERIFLVQTSEDWDKENKRTNFKFRPFFGKTESYIVVQHFHFGGNFKEEEPTK